MDGLLIFEIIIGNIFKFDDKIGNGLFSYFQYIFFNGFKLIYVNFYLKM